MEVSREEAKRILRRLELEAYSSIISTFRAQGDLNREKKKLLTDLGVHLSISTERHRAEVRRAYSDDRLGAVAECIVGPSTCSEWAAEGRRLVPLMPRLVPQTVLSGTATASANAAAASNAQIAQAKKVSIPVSASTTSSAKASPAKPLARQSSETVDVEYDSDDNKAKKKRKLSQSLTSPKAVQKISLNPSIVGTKAGAKTTSVSTSTMTKTGKTATSTGTVKATPKLMLPASASQVKLLTKTVSITQTVSQAKTVLNYKTVAATNPVKVQTVMSHSTPKPQVKMTTPATSKNVLVPKASVSTSPTKAVAGPSQIKSGITMSQLATAKQRGKQTTRFKPMPGAIKYKSVTALAMGLPSAPVTMATANTKISTITGSASTTVSSTQPIVRVIQVSGTGSTSTMSKTIPTVSAGPPKVATLPISAGSSITKIPISTTQTMVTASTTQANKLMTTSSIPSMSTTAKTVVMTTIVGGTKKVVLSVPAPISPVQSKPSVNITKTTKTPGLTTQPSQGKADNTTKLDGSNSSAVPSLECTEPSSVLQAPTPIVTKQVTSQVSSTQVRTRPLQTLLPAPPKPVIVAPASSLSSNSSMRKLPQILPAPAKSTVLVPMSTPPATQTACTTVVCSGSTSVHPKMPLVQFVAKSTSPAAKISVPKTVPLTSTKDPVALPTVLQPIQQTVIASQAPLTAIKTIPEQKPSTVSESSIPFCELSENNDKATSSKIEKNDSDTPKETSVSEENKIDGDSNTSSEDDSLLVCSETIDCGAGLQDIQNEMSTSPVDVLAESTPLKSTDQSSIDKDKIISKATEDKMNSFEENPNSGSNKKVIVEMLDHFESPLLSKEDTKSVLINKPEKKDDLKDTAMENNTNLNENEDIDKVVNNENFDAVSSFLETFAGTSIDNSSKDTAEENVNILPDITNSFKEENQVSEPKKVFPPLNYNENKIERTLLNEAPSQNPLLSAFDILDTPITQTMESKAQNVSFLSNDGINSLPALHQPAYTLPKESSDKLRDGTLTGVKSLKSFAENSLEQSIQNSTHCHKEQSLSQNSSESIDACSTTLSFDNNEVAASCSDGQELTESEKLALEAIANVRTSSRKRKPPTVLTLSPPRQTSGWVRGALSLLQKVCSYRGQGRKKGDYSAASWFLRPVDPNEAPGYFKVIKNPMDLGTIKTKLETGAYQDYIEFHEDMLLIKSNCFKYNPPGHDIRKDCEEVFNYFDAEYEKMLERWEKCHVSPAKKPRTIQKQELTSSGAW